MGYLEILKRSLAVTNRNLAAILAQLAFGLFAVVLAVVMVFLFIGMFAGSLSGISLSSLSPEVLLDVLKSSIGLIFAAVLAAMVFIVVVWVLSVAVQAGILGCLIGSARDGSSKFTLGRFFSSLRASTAPLVWFQLVLTALVMGITAAFALAGVALFYFVLGPLRDAGELVVAFVMGVPFIVVLIISALVFYFFAYLGGMLASVMLVAERIGASAAADAAYSFVKARFWDVVLFSLLVLFVTICASAVTQLLGMPFDLASKMHSKAAFAFLPLVFVSALINMYVGLFTQSCFVVYYISAGMPPASEPAMPPPETPGPRSEGEDPEGFADAWNDDAGLHAEREREAAGVGARSRPGLSDGKHAP